MKIHVMERQPPLQKEEEDGDVDNDDDDGEVERLSKDTVVEVRRRKKLGLFFLSCFILSSCFVV